MYSTCSIALCTIIVYLLTFHPYSTILRASLRGMRVEKLRRVKYRFCDVLLSGQKEGCLKAKERLFFMFIINQIQKLTGPKLAV